MIQKLFKIAAILVYILFITAIATKLFLPKQFEKAFEAVKNLQLSVPEKALIIGFSEPAISLNPLTNDTGSRSRLLSIYEPLVRITPDLQVEPALAISYGALDDLTWEFRLRPEVMFHNGAPLTFEDVEASLLAAKEDQNSGVRDLAATIKEIKKIDDAIFHITTERPDPLLLQKISYLLIFPQRPSGSKGENAIIGTGSYRFESEEKGTLTLSRFEGYWSRKPAFARAVLKTFTHKDEKITALKNRAVDIVVSVPPDSADDFNYKKFVLKTRPTLETNFLMFNFDKTFRERSLREAVALALDTKQLSHLAAGYATPLSQFVSDGIFGFNPIIKASSHNPPLAKALVKNFLESTPITPILDLPKGLEVFGNAVKVQLKNVGIDVDLNFLSLPNLSKKIAARQSEFYFFGWRSDLGDSGDFLTAVVHSPSGNFGQFNGGNYSNSEVDQLIEEAQNTIEPAERLKKLREVMKKITVDDIIGVPLFSPEVLYGVSTGVKWTPRVDGYVLAQEVKL